jgi:hypothetical protein
MNSPSLLNLPAYDGWHFPYVREIAQSLPKASRVLQSNRGRSVGGRYYTESELDRVPQFYASCFGLWPAIFSDFYFSASRVQKIETQHRNSIRRVGQGYPDRPNNSQSMGSIPLWRQAAPAHLSGHFQVETRRCEGEHPFINLADTSKSEKCHPLFRGNLGDPACIRLRKPLPDGRHLSGYRVVTFKPSDEIESRMQVQDQADGNSSEAA